MKKIVIVIAIAMTTSCAERTWTVKRTFDGGRTWTTIKCDSVQVTAEADAYMFVNGMRIQLTGEDKTKYRHLNK